MTAIQHSKFTAAKVQAVVDRVWALGPPRPGGPPTVASYEEFTAAVPPTGPEAYAGLAGAALAQHPSTPWYVGGSSGTTNKAKLVLSRVPAFGTKPSDEERALVGELLRRRIFRSGDVVVNGFTVGLFSLLHHAMNRILEACKVSIVPLGAPDEENIESQLRFLSACKANVLVATPGTLVQLAHAVARTGIRLPVERVVFTGERLGHVKAGVLESAFPGVIIRGLYGTSECGFLGVGEEQAGAYELFEDSFLFESDGDGRLFITALDPGLPVPILRYPPGDKVELQCGQGRALLRRIDRTNLDFNFMGNLVELVRLRSVVSSVLELEDPVFEVELRTKADGRDQMTLRVLGLADERQSRLETVQSRVRQLPEIREAFEKNAGTVDVVAGGEVADAALSGRMKQRHIIDLRS